MIKKWLLLHIALLCSFLSFGQKGTGKKTLRIAVFSQLYLDSSFINGEEYRFDAQMPKHILPGLDFTEGFLTGLDSIDNAQHVEVRIYDIKSKNQKIADLTRQNVFDSIDLIIGAVSGSEYRILAETALNYQIPFLSATFPNDGGITKNPFTIILSPTIAIHCQGIIQYLQQSFGEANLIMLQKKGAQEEKIKRYFENSNQSKNIKKSLRWSYHIASDSFDLSEISELLDSTKRNIVICASFDEKLAVQCFDIPADLKDYNIEFVGLPNWETLKELNQPKFKERTVYYSSSFFNDGSEGFADFQKLFSDRTQGKASDVAYKGYDIAMNFVQLLIRHENNFINQINDPAFHRLIQYNIQPVKLNSKQQPDYFENRRIYIVKKANGLTSKMGKF